MQSCAGVNITAAMISIEAVNENLELLELAEWKDESTDVDEEFSSGYRVYQNYPNPYSESTIVSFELPGEEKVTIEVFDLLGRKMQESTGTYRAGRHSLQLGDELTEGVYYLRFRIGAFIHPMKMLHL